MPRKSRAARELELLLPRTKAGFLISPSHLSPAERDMFIAVVRSKPTTHFDAGNAPQLAQYCTIQATEIPALLREIGKATGFARESKQARLETLRNRADKLANKLRLNPPYARPDRSPGASLGSGSRSSQPDEQQPRRWTHPRDGDPLLGGEAAWGPTVWDDVRVWWDRQPESVKALGVWQAIHAWQDEHGIDGNGKPT